MPVILKHTLFYSFLLLFIAPYQILGQSNEGFEFWFGFMEHYDVGVNTKVAMITSKRDTKGVISVPLRGWSQSFSVSSNDVTVVTLPSFTEHTGSEKIENLGIQIITTDPSSVYIHQYHSMRSEAALVLPVSSLGKSHYIMTYEGAIVGNSEYPSEFLIVATEDETQITIQLSTFTEGGQSANSSINIILNRGESYQVRAAEAHDDLTGSYIVSDKNIAVFGGNQWTGIPSGCGFRDNLLEQMYPIDTWGTKFISVPNAKVNYDVFRILAAEDNTEVTINSDNVQSFIINKGKFKEFQLSSPSFIEASNPVLVAQFNVGTSCSGYSLGDPSMVLLNSFEQLRDTVTLFNSSFQFIEENYINIITKTEDKDNILFDGQSLSGLGIQFLSIGSNQQFSFTRMEVQSGSHTIISGGCGVIVTAYGYGNVESYAYSGGASFNKINANPIPEGGCLNDTIYFDSGLSPERFQVHWDLGDGTTSEKPVFDHFYDELGSYPVRLIVQDLCLNSADTIDRDVIVSLRQAVNVIDDIEICEGNSFALGATDVEGARYEWYGPNDYFKEEQFPITQSATIEMAGQYDVIGIVSGCATFPASANVLVRSNPVPDLGKDSVICTLDDEGLVLNPGFYEQYVWQDGSTYRDFYVESSGQFSVQVFDEFGCTGLDTLLLEEQCPTEIYLPNAFNPGSSFENNLFGVFGHDIIKINLKVFDRWGNMVFQANHPEDKWDGRWEGKIADQGVYVWFLEYNGYLADGNVYSDRKTGTVTLFR